MKRLFCVFIVLLFVAGCGLLKKGELAAPRVPVKPKAKAGPLVLVPDAQVPVLADDLDRESIIIAAERSLQHYDQVSKKRTYRFGESVYGVQEMRESLLEFLEIVKSSEPAERKDKKFRERFDLYKSVSRSADANALFTGYYEPILEGSLQKDDKYKHPVYRIPDDLLVVNLGNFKTKYKGERIVGRVSGKELIPYYNRRNIDQERYLENRDLEIAWLSDPIDLFFLHIQGSGIVMLPDGDFLQIGYAGANGRPYRSIGRYLIDKGKITEKEISHQAIKRYLKSHPGEISEILAHNESYVFFRVVPEGPVGSINVPLTEGRSIATDPDLYPRGALAFIRTRKPVFDTAGRLVSWTPLTRFVLNQDTGGVIKGPGRVDLFCGTGEDAELMAGSMKEDGELYFIVKKKKGEAQQPLPDRVQPDDCPSK